LMVEMMVKVEGSRTRVETKRRRVSRRTDGVVTGKGDA
jgi:hypothetical protein